MFELVAQRAVHRGSAGVSSSLTCRDRRPRGDPNAERLLTSSPASDAAVLGKTRKLRGDATPTGLSRTLDGQVGTKHETGALMKAKLLRDAGKIVEGAVVEIESQAGTNDARTDEDVGGWSATVAPVYAVTDTEGHAEEVDTRGLEALP